MAGAGILGRRDATPIASAQYFLSLAEAEVGALGMDTCADEAGRAMLGAAARRRIVFCASRDANQTDAEGISPGDADARARLAAASTLGARVECMPLRPLGFQNGNATPGWWPATSAPCVSRHLRPVHRINQRHFVAPRCGVTRAGGALRDVAAEAFVGAAIVDAKDGQAECKRVLGHTVLFVQRQDQWNP